MSTDFDDLVLGPSMDAFAETITVDPLVSQPGELPYQCRAIFTSRPLDVVLDDGSIMADQRTEIGYRLSEFAVPPTGRDLITIRGVQYIGVSAHFDGQGGGTLVLRRTKPAGATPLPVGYLWGAAAVMAGSGAVSGV